MGIDKVAAFITRDPERDPGRRELLVFDHSNPLAGTQVPAGTVEPGEELAVAALREAREESGLEGLLLVGDPLRGPSDLRDGEWYLELNAGGRAVLEARDLGHPIVRVEDQNGERVLLSGERSDGAALRWWEERALVTQDVRRWLFQLEAPPHGPDQWERAFDAPEPWRFRWVPLSGPPPSLVPRQVPWLEMMRTRIKGE